MDRAEQALKEAEVEYRDPVVDDGSAMLRFDSSDAQLRGRSVLQETLGSDYVAALSLAATTPDWLRAIGATPMNLGLDLRGGVHFLMEVDMEAAVDRRLDVFASEIKRKLREKGVRYRGGEAKEGSFGSFFRVNRRGRRRRPWSAPSTSSSARVTGLRATIFCWN